MIEEDYRERLVQRLDATTQKANAARVGIGGKKRIDSGKIAKAEPDQYVENASNTGAHVENSSITTDFGMPQRQQLIPRRTKVGHEPANGRPVADQVAKPLDLQVTLEAIARQWWLERVVISGIVASEVRGHFDELHGAAPFAFGIIKLVSEAKHHLAGAASFRL